MSAKEHLPESSDQEPPKSNAFIVGALIPNQSEPRGFWESELLDWVEKHHAQVWFDRHRNLWTCQVMYHPHVIQPSRATLRAVISDAKSQFEKLKYPAT